MIREFALRETVPELVANFDRLMGAPERLDKRCAATTEIIQTLYEFDYAEPGPYLCGLRHVQMEASFGPPVDVAAALRGLCAQGLMRTRWPRALSDVMPLLVDREPPARIGAVRALATNGGEAGALLLRLKVLTGDAEVEVLGECFLGLLQDREAPALDFVLQYARSDDEAVREAALLAIGSSRCAGAFESLRTLWAEFPREAARKTLVLAFALLRSEEAADFLSDVIGGSSRQLALTAVTALAGQGLNEHDRATIYKAVAERGDHELLSAFRDAFRAGIDR